jgi:hypothetical protein
MPTEIHSKTNAQCSVVNDECVAALSLNIHHLSLNIALAERISVFTCATDYCPLLCPLRNGEMECYFLMPNRSITAR